jgi:hypothetical protein
MERMAKVVHCKKAPKGSFVYIGRPSIFGNPYELRDPRDEEARRRVIEQYQAWFHERIETDPEFRAETERLRGHDLGCWCAPRACHGDVIIAWLEEHPTAG